MSLDEIVQGARKCIDMDQTMYAQRQWHVVCGGILLDPVEGPQSTLAIGKLNFSSQNLYLRHTTRTTNKRGLIVVAVDGFEVGC